MVRQVASWGCSRNRLVSAEAQPRCTAAQASPSMARAEKTVSRQPRLPQTQTGPSGSTVRWPRCPATPEWPRSNWPLASTAPPTPLPSVSITTWLWSRAAPQTISPASATRASLSAKTGTSRGRPTRSARRRPWRKCRCPGRTSMRVLSGSMMPLQPTPTPAGSSVASSSQRMPSCSEDRKPSRSAGVSTVRDATMAPCSSTMPAFICVLPISIPSTTTRTSDEFAIFQFSRARRGAASQAAGPRGHPLLLGTRGSRPTKRLRCATQKSEICYRWSWLVRRSPFVNHRASILRSALERRAALVVPGCHDALSARTVESAGFEAVQISGFGVAGSLLGKPDVGLVDMKDVLDITGHIVRAVRIPVMADIDTGGGNAINAAAITERLIEMGVAGVNIEDQVFPKRCGHMEGKQVISAEEMAGKVRAMADARQRLGADIVINARTDSYAGLGIEEAIRRANLYLDSGADMAFLDGIGTRADIERAVRGIHGLVSVNLMDAVTGAKTEVIPIPELAAMGVARVSIPVASIMVTHKALMDFFGALHASPTGILAGETDRITSFKDYTAFVGLPEYRALEREYLLAKENHGHDAG